MLDKNDLPTLEQNLNRIIELITEHGCKNSPDINRLKLIQKNIKIFQKFNEGWDELNRYISEDWNTAMRSQKKIMDCYIPGEDIDLKALYNKELEECFGRLDKLFETNWFSKRKWYTKQELIELGRKDDVVCQTWKNCYSFVVKSNCICKSKIVGISDEAWTYAKCLCVASTEVELINWFHSDIPVFGYISLVAMSELENGEGIVKYFLSNIPISYP